MTLVKPTVFFMCAMIACMTISQVFLKFAGNHAALGLNLVESYVINPWMWLAVMASGVGLVCWLLVLRDMPLSAAYPWTAMIYVITPLASVVLFDDVLDSKYLAGMASILLGIVVATRGVRIP